MLGKVLFLVTIFLWILLSIFTGWIIQKFVFSKPAGRRMITGDISALAYITGNLTAITLCLAITARTIFGPLPHYLVFVVNEALVLTFCLSLGTFNVSAFLHILLIFHSRCFLCLGAATFPAPCMTSRTPSC